MGWQRPVMRIHFVCTGNIYRSRLAEAYCASRCGTEIEVSSSGIAAGMNGDTPIASWAADILGRHGLTSFAAAHWQRTTEGIVRASDVLVFMEAEHRRFCEDWIEPARQRIEVWGVEDIGPIEPTEIAGKVERTFAAICGHTGILLANLRLPETGSKC
jgi:protein-tyrosine-phosphatase